MRKYAWQNAVLMFGFLCSLAIIGVFGVRLVRHSQFRRADEPLRPWMTLPYIAHAYHVPVVDLYQALNISPVLHDRRTVMKLSKDLKLPLAEVTTKLKQAIQRVRPTFTVPTKIPTSTPVPRPLPKPSPNT